MKSSGTRCPHCDTPLLITPQPIGSSWRQSTRKTFHSMMNTGTPAVDNISEWQKSVPVGRLVPMDVMTSLFHGTVVGCFVVVNLFAGTVSVYLIAEYQGLYWLCLIPMAGLLGMTFTYLSAMGLAKSLLEQVEMLFGKDDEPAEVEPQPEAPQLDITIRNEKGKVVKRSRPTLPKGVSYELFSMWCSDVSQGIRGISEKGVGRPRQPI